LAFATFNTVATDQLDLKALPIAARKVHKFRAEEIAIPLVSVPVFTANNMTVLFTKNKVTLKNEKGIAPQIYLWHPSLIPQT